MISDSNKINYWFLLCWFLITCWLLLSAFLTQAEYADGYSTIVNGRYLYGDSEFASFQRGPLAGLAMWPVELFIDWMIEWNPMDVRPYHFYSALLHSLYVLGCWILLKSIVPGQSKHAGTAQLLAFVAAILSVVFYAYAPYLNHDIIPGLLFLVMICLFHSWFDKPSIKISFWIVLIGTAATFIKQTYAVFWVVLIIYAVIAYVCKWDEQRVTGRKLSILFVLACFSAMLSWLGWGVWLATQMPNEPLILRPWLMVNEIFEMFDPADQIIPVFPKSLYLRNIYNYGICAVLLVIPGLISAYRSHDPRLRMIAICWLLGVAIMQLITFKEVRYLLFLAPLTAVLIFPIIQYMLKRRMLTIILIILVLIDQYRGWSLAAKQLISTARVNVTQFINAPDNKGRVIVSEHLSFIYMADSPLERDMYHGLYHISSLNLYLMHEGRMDIVELKDPRNLGQVGIKPGDRVYYGNLTLTRRPPWHTTHNKPANADHLRLISGDVVRVQLVRQDNRYTIKNNEGYSVMFIPNKAVGQQMPVISSSGLSMEQAQRLYGDIQTQDDLSVVAVFIKGLCQSEQCAYEQKN